MKAPHVLIDALVLRAPMGGALRYAIETWPRCAELLHARGARLSVLCAEDEREADWLADLRDLPHLHMDFVDAPMHPALRRALRETQALQRWIDRSAQLGSPVHVLQTQSLPIPKLRFEGKHVHLFHGLRRLLSGSPLARRFAEALLHQGIRHVSSALAVSETLAADLVARFPDLSVDVASPACDQRRVLKRAPESFVLCPGPVVPHKNHGLLIEAWGLDPGLPPLRLYAECDGLGPKLLRRVRALGLQDRISWHSPLVEKTWPEALATCAAVVLPSRLESFGMVALEALKAGAPLAATNLPAHIEVFCGALDSVALFPPDDPRACARAIHRALALDDPESQTHRQARSQAFGWGDTARRTVAHWCAESP